MLAVDGHAVVVVRVVRVAGDPDEVRHRVAAGRPQPNPVPARVRPRRPSVSTSSLLLSQPGQFQLCEHQLLLCEDLKEGGVAGELAEVVGLLPGEVDAAVEEKASEPNGRSVDPGLGAKGSVAQIVQKEQSNEKGGWYKHP